MKDKIKPFLLTFVSLVILLFCKTTLANILTPQEIAKRALGATVLLVMKDSNGQVLSRGSGFFVQPNQIATNYHVIEGAAAGTAKRVGKEIVYTIEGRTAMDEERDLAILRVSAPDVQPLPLGDSEAVKIGDAIYVAGNPEGIFEGTFSDGIISGIRGHPKNKQLQMTAPISPGSSGGPVLNNCGEVIGISVTIFNGGQNLNFAVPSNDLQTLITGLTPAKPLSQGKSAVSAETYFKRGNIKIELGLYNDAMVAFEIVIRLKPDYSEAYAGRAIAKISLGQYAEGIRDYDAAIRLKPDKAEVYVNRGFAKVKLRQYAEAIADYDTAIQLESDDAKVYVSRGLAKFELQQYAEAIADYDMAIQLESDDAKVYVSRGLAKFKLQQYTEAIADYDTAIRLNPEDVKIYGNRGMANALSGQYSEAIKDYDTAILLKPDYTESYAARGMAKANLGQYASAIKDFDTVFRLTPDYTPPLKPDYAMAYCSRGLAKANLGQYTGAIKDFNTVFRLVPNYAPPLRPDYALAYYSRGLAKANST